jgi:hypothetical protein
MGKCCFGELVGHANLFNYIEPDAYASIRNPSNNKLAIRITDFLAEFLKTVRK